MDTLTNRTAIVTGAGQGLGRQEALSLASEGAHIVVNDLGENADAVVAEILAAGGSAEANRDNVATWEGGRNLVEQAVRHNGTLDILVCNAGIVRDRMLYNLSDGDWDAVIDVHLRGHFAPIRSAAAHWRERSKQTAAPVYGRIVTTASEAGLFGHEGQANYSAAKAGIIGLTQVASRELARFGVTANAICPRGRTPMTDAAFGAIELLSGDFDRWDPANVAPWITFLSGPEAGSITGQVFVVHGGTVSRMGGWHEVARIERDSIWTVEDLSAGAAKELIPELDAQLDPFPDFLAAEGAAR